MDLVVTFTGPERLVSPKQVRGLDVRLAQREFCVLFTHRLPVSLLTRRHSQHGVKGESFAILVVDLIAKAHFRVGIGLVTEPTDPLLVHDLHVTVIRGAETGT
ncbi:hypothetical protein D3C77_293550 [compost metagenome]